MSQQSSLTASIDSRLREATRSHTSGFTLEFHDKEYLLRAARIILEQDISKNTIEETDFENIPDNLARQDAKVFVTIYNGMHIRGCMSSSAGNLLKSTIAATRKSIRDPRFGGRFKRSELDNARLDIVLLLEPELVKGKDIKTLNKEIILGVHGIRVIQADKSAFFKSNVPINKGYSLAKTLTRLSRKAGLPGNAYKQADAVIEKYSSFHFRENFNHRFDKSQAVELYRNRPVVFQKDINRESLESSLRIAGRYLRNHTTVKGRLSYVYNPYGHERSYSLAPAALLRRLASIWILAEIGHYFNEPSYLRAAKRGISYVIDKFYIHDPVNNRGYIKVKDVAHVGLAGFTLCCLSSINDDDFMPEIRNAIGNLILSLEDQESHFIQATILPAPTPMDSPKQIYYPGEALTSLMREAANGVRTDEYLPVVERVFDFYNSLYDKVDQRINMSAWMSKAYAGAYNLTKNQKYADFVFKINDFVASRQHKLTVAEADRIGSFTNNGKSYTSGVFLESIAEGLDVALSCNQSERIQKYSESLFIGLRYLLQMQYTEKDCFDDISRRLTIGGFQTTLFDPTVRIDNVQHCACAILRAIQIMNFKY